MQGSFLHRLSSPVSSEVIYRAFLEASAMPVPGAQVPFKRASPIFPCPLRKCSLRTALIDHGLGLGRSPGHLNTQLTSAA